MCFHDCSLGKYRHIDVSKYSNEDKADAITNRILERILPVGELVTFAENFRSGRLRVKDEEEAKNYTNAYLIWQKNQTIHMLCKDSNEFFPKAQIYLQEITL